MKYIRVRWNHDHRNMPVWLISEPFAAYHAVALALVIGGIWLAQRTRSPR